MSPMVILSILKDYGIQVAGMAVIIALLWKMMTNHLRHIGSDVKEVLGKVTELEKGFIKMGERVSFLEGKTSRRKKSGK
jgi:hypothetical protein